MLTSVRGEQRSLSKRRGTMESWNFNWLRRKKTRVYDNLGIANEDSSRLNDEIEHLNLILNSISLSNDVTTPNTWNQSRVIS